MARLPADAGPAGDPIPAVGPAGPAGGPSQLLRGPRAEPPRPGGVGPGP
jgi:hypothetical protein